MSTNPTPCGAWAFATQPWDGVEPIPIAPLSGTEPLQSLCPQLCRVLRDRGCGVLSSTGQCSQPLRARNRPVSIAPDFPPMPTETGLRGLPYLRSLLDEAPDNQPIQRTLNGNMLKEHRAMGSGQDIVRNLLVRRMTGRGIAIGSPYGPQSLAILLDSVEYLSELRQFNIGYHLSLLLIGRQLLHGRDGMLDRGRVGANAIL